MQIGRTALMRAAEKGNTEFVHLLLESGAAKDSTDMVRIMNSRSI